MTTHILMDRTLLCMFVCLYWNYQYFKVATRAPARCESQGRRSPMWSSERILAGCLFPPLGLISFSNNVRRHRRSAAPAAAMPKVDSYRSAAVFIYTCHQSCAPKYTSCQICHQSFRRRASPPTLFNRDIYILIFFGFESTQLAHRV